FDAYATAIRGVDPSLKLGAIGTSDTNSYCDPACGGSGTCPAPHWNEVVLTSITQKADFFAVHYAYAPYTDQNDANVWQAMLAYPSYLSFVDSLVENDIN